MAVTGQSGRVSSIHWMTCMVGADIMTNVWSPLLSRRADVNLPGPHPWRAISPLYVIFESRDSRLSGGAHHNHTESNISGSL